MIYPTIGLSTITHVAIAVGGKLKSFLKIRRKKPKSQSLRFAKAKKFFSALLIAVIIETVAFSVLGTAALAIYFSIDSDMSNYNLIKTAVINFENIIK